MAVGDPNAMVSTATPDGRPSVRTVLLRAVDGDGFVFFTNRASRKGAASWLANPRAALLFPRHPLGRQVVVEGPGKAPVPDEASDAYWASSRGSQLAARRPRRANRSLTGPPSTAAGPRRRPPTPAGTSPGPRTGAACG